MGSPEAELGPGDEVMGTSYPEVTLSKGMEWSPRASWGHLGGAGSQAKPGWAGILIRELFIRFGGQNGCE